MLAVGKDESGVQCQQRPVFLVEVGPAVGGSTELPCIVVFNAWGESCRSAAPVGSPSLAPGLSSMFAYFIGALEPILVLGPAPWWCPI